ncbi:hypothetical protein FB451DRAFT_1481932 [Mycena latifolia]|nr:hypothetical protein FB451DRAFT_1481932 [Mycena latifolia]
MMGEDKVMITGEAPEAPTAVDPSGAKSMLNLYPRAVRSMRVLTIVGTALPTPSSAPSSAVTPQLASASGHEDELSGVAPSNHAVFSRPSHSRGTTSTRTRQQRARTESHEGVPTLRDPRTGVDALAVRAQGVSPRCSLCSLLIYLLPAARHGQSAYLSVRPFRPRALLSLLTSIPTRDEQPQYGEYAARSTEQCALNYTATSTRTRPAVVRRLTNGPVPRPALLHDAMCVPPSARPASAAPLSGVLNYHLYSYPPRRHFRLTHQAAFGATDRDVRGEQGVGASVIRLGVLDSRGERNERSSKRRARNEPPIHHREQGRETRAKDSQRPPDPMPRAQERPQIRAVLCACGSRCGVAPVRPWCGLPSWRRRGSDKAGSDSAGTTRRAG